MMSAPVVAEAQLLRKSAHPVMNAGKGTEYAMDVDEESAGAGQRRTELGGTVGTEQGVEAAQDPGADDERHGGQTRGDLARGAEDADPDDAPDHDGEAEGGTQDPLEGPGWCG